MINTHDIVLIGRHLTGHREPVRSDEEHLNAAFQWLRYCQDVTGSGGVAGLYSLLQGWYDAYPETTGYIIQTFVDRYRETKDPEYLQRAVRMAEWELSIQLPDGAVRGYCLKKGVSDIPLVFDTGQVVMGWSSLYRCTGETRYRDAAVRASEWLLRNQAEDGTWSSHLYWDHCGTYLSRVAWAMMQCANDAQRDDLMAGAVRFQKWVVANQNENGFFVRTGFSPKNHYFTHSIAYTIEGLIGASEESRNADDVALFRAAALRCCDQLAERIRQDGKMFGEYAPTFHSSDKNYVCLTGTIQFAWCLLKLLPYTQNPSYRPVASLLIDEAKSLHILDIADPRFHGAVVGSYPVWGRYQRWRLLSWAAKFFCDTLMLNQSLND